MRPSKILILFLVGFLVFGSAGFFAYKLFWKPYTNTASQSTCSLCSFFKKAKSSATALPSPTPDLSLKDLEAAFALQQAGKLFEAQQALQAWLQAYPSSVKKNEALSALGKINMEQLCSASSLADKESYTVIKGDSLDRIARKQKSNAELIQKVNALSGINLQIGEVLLIPQLQMSLDIDRQAGLLTLRNHGQFLKSYTLLAAPAAGPEQKPLETIIVDKMAMNGAKRTAFGDKKYPESEQIILLRSAGNIVTAPTASSGGASESTNPVTMPAGFVLAPADMREIFPFTGKDTPVTVH
jgi:LysM repeat protein